MKVFISRILFLAVALFIITFSCKKPFTPALSSTDHAYLVVEGVINSGSDSTIIKLSRTVPLTSRSFSRPEQGASVMVESDQNDHYLLQEVFPGEYAITGLNFPTDRHYRLHVYTADGREYASDYVENKITPPIDSIYSEIQKSGVQFYVSAHDDNDKTKYYRWDYTETWSYAMPYLSLLIYKNGNIAPRDPDSLIQVCYKNFVPSNSIFLSNSTKLFSDVISHFPLGYVDASTGKITKVYSLAVRQYALTADAYKYWELIKKNTEQLGSVFDPEPSESISNIHCLTNKAEPVVGYVSVSTISVRRAFVIGRKLPFGENQHSGDTVACAGGIIWMKPEYTYLLRLHDKLASGDSIPIEVETRLGDFGYSYANKECVDCRLRGGTTTKPSYWPSDQ